MKIFFKVIVGVLAINGLLWLPATLMSIEDTIIKNRMDKEKADD